MATYAQRAQAIADAVLNAAATPTQINRVGAAIAVMTGQESHYAALSNAQRAEFMVRHYRSVTIGWVRSSDANTAADQAQAQAEIDLPETP